MICKVRFLQNVATIDIPRLANRRNTNARMVIISITLPRSSEIHPADHDAAPRKYHRHSNANNPDAEQNSHEKLCDAVLAEFPRPYDPAGKGQQDQDRNHAADQARDTIHAAVTASFG